MWKVTDRKQEQITKRTFVIKIERKKPNKKDTIRATFFLKEDEWLLEGTGCVDFSLAELEEMVKISKELKSLKGGN